MKKLKSILIGILIPISCAFSYDSSDFQSWNNILIMGNFSKLDEKYSGLRYELFISQRFGNSTSLSYQSVYRGGLGYSLNSHHSLWLGGDYVFTKNLIPEEINRSGIWQQYLYENNYSKLKYFFRARLEQLFASNASYLIYRARVMVRGSIPISEDMKYNAIAFNEYFQNLNGDGVIENNTLIQNRAFAGLGYNFTKTTSLEVGYQNQYIHNNQGFDFLNNMVLASLVLNFN